MRASLAFLPLIALGAASLGAPACVMPSIGSSTGQDAGPAPTASAAADSGTPPVQGASCSQLTSTVALCQYISSCPSLVLNAQVFPQCGFRIHGTAIDPECVCGTSLCPIGVPTTCAEAAAMASGDTTYDSVCQQALQGGCASLTGASGSSTTTAACQTCVTNCDNVPSCIDACGC